jgi:hypothetical protein
MIDLRLGLTLGFCGILPSAAGPVLNGPMAHLRHPELVRRFEAARLTAHCDARGFVESVRSR